MLQWMGGSRRKMTTSRKSTHYRQKQYFEQRKRQQQQLAAGFEGYADEIRIAEPHQKEQRSLDILNLLNLSANAKESKSSCSTVREDAEVNASRVKYHITKGLQATPDCTIASRVPVEIDRARTSSGYQTETISPKKASRKTRDNLDDVFNGTNSSPDVSMAAAEQQLSVFDLLGDDGPNCSLEGSPVCEAHVAFSVEGLGTVETETPVHSPQQPARMFSYQHSSPWNAPRRPDSSYNLKYMLDDLELEVDAILQDNDMPLGGCSVGLSMGMMDSCSNRKQKLPTVRGHILCDSKINSSFCDTKTLDNIGHINEDTWDDYLTWKNKPCQMDGNSAHFLKYGRADVSDHTFEGTYQLGKRDYIKATEIFNILESPAPRRQTSETYHDFESSKGASRHPVSERIFDFGDKTNQPDWSCFEAEDLLSEESCSSSAVMGEATGDSLPNPPARWSRRYSYAFCSPRRNSDEENIFATDTQHKNRNGIKLGRNAQGSGKYLRTPFRGKSKLPSHVYFPFQGKLETRRSRLFEEGCSSIDMNSSFSSFCGTSEALFPSSGSELLTEDPFHAFPVPKLHADTKSSFHTPTYIEFEECSPFGRFASEKLVNHEPCSRTNSHDSPTLSKVVFKPAKPDSCPDFALEVIPPETSQVASPLAEAQVPHLSLLGSFSKEQNKSRPQPDNCRKFESGKEIQGGNGHLLPENLGAADASTSKGSNTECKEVKDRALELKESLQATNSSEYAEGTSSSVDIPVNFESSMDAKGYNDVAEIPLPCQKVSEGIGDGMLDERTKVTKRSCHSVDSSQPVMMLESYVLQLLCVQKVPEEATILDTIKKV